MDDIGKKIKEYRKQNGISQNSLAEMLGISAQAISKWETGQTFPDIALLVPLCSILGVSVDEMLGGNTKQKFEKQYRDVMPLGPKAQLLVAEEALKSFPNDETWLSRRAVNEQCIGDVPGNEGTLYLHRASMHFRELTTLFPDDSSHQASLARVLFKLGYVDSALEIAYQNEHKDDLLKTFLSGEDEKKHRQTILRRKVGELFHELLSYNTIESLTAAKELLNIYYGKEAVYHSYWYIHDMLACLYSEAGDTKASLYHKEEAYRLAKLCGNIPEDMTHSAPLCDLIDFRRDTESLSGFISRDFSADEWHDLKLTVIEENFKAYALQRGLWQDYIYFYRDCARPSHTSLIDFSTHFDMSQEEIDESDRRFLEKAMDSKNASIENYVRFMELARNLIKTGRLSGYFASLQRNIVGFCNCGDRKKYHYIGLSDEEKDIPTAPDGAKIFSIVDLTVAESFAMCGIEERLIGFVCDRARSEGYEYAEAYPCNDIFDGDNYDKIVAIYGSLGFENIRTVSDIHGKRQIILQKAL